MVPVLSKLAEKRNEPQLDSRFTPLDEVTCLDRIGESTLLRTDLVVQDTGHTKVVKEHTDDR